MSGPVYLPVRERAIAALQTELYKIKQATGYNFTVAHVLRQRQIPDRCDEPPTIFLLFSDTSTQPGYNNQEIKETADVDIWFMIPDAESAERTDTYYNCFIGDLQKKLGPVDGGDCFQLQDPSYTGTKNGGKIDIELINHAPFYDQAIDGLIKGRMTLSVSYVFACYNPNIWDDSDSEVAYS